MFVPQKNQDSIEAALCVHYTVTVAAAAAAGHQM